MAKSRITVSILLLKIVYKLICWLTDFTSSSNKLIRVKITVGTLILTLNSALAFSQDKTHNSKTIYSKNDTLKQNITLDDDVISLEDVVVLCYYGGPPSYREPFYFGGENALQAFVSKNLIYPPKALKKRVEGVVELSYIVDIKGKVKDIKVIKSLGFGCDKEAQRVVSLLQFNRGYKERRPAEFEKTILIKFNLPNE